jgi:hypothetical protein
MKQIFLFLICAASITFSNAQGTVIGKTSYDLQTNNSSKNRIIVYPDSQISTLWTGSTDYTIATTYPDRGMFYNHYDGTDWMPIPTTRIEDVRTGFGELLHVADHEVVISHDGINIRIYANSEIGASDWAELSGSEDITGLWPMAYSPKGSDTIYVVNANSITPTAIHFSRSDDGGETWTILNYTLPFLTTAEGIPALSNAADVYQVVAHGADVYVLFGMINSDLVLLHSDNFGSDGSWESTIIHDFPIDNYTGAGSTDIDGDGIYDTIPTTDGSHDMIIEDGGTVHVFSGYYEIYGDEFAGFWTVNWRTMGLWHWETGMPSAEKIDVEIDWDNSDGLNDPYAGIGANHAQYRSAGNASMPGSAWDSVTGRIYVVYTMPIEYTDIYGDPLNPAAQSFRDIFGIYTDDGGATWTSPANITNTAESGQENVYVFVYERVVGGNIHGIWQQDDEPGTIITDFDPIDTNYIRYAAWSEEDFATTVVVDCSSPDSLFVDEITGSGATLHWGTDSAAAAYRVVIYEVPDSSDLRKFTVFTNMFAIDSLTPLTTYGFRVRTSCSGDLSDVSDFSDWYFFTTGPGKFGSFETSVALYPNPSTGEFTLQLNGYENTNFKMSLYNASGQLIYNKPLIVSESSHTEFMDLSNVAKGLYHLKLVSTHNTITYPVIITR